MKRVVIVHGWEGHPGEGWFPWLKQELETRGYKVEVPAMPDPDMPHAGTWVPKLANTIGKPDKDTVLVGHSIGCITILRYLEDTGGEIGGAVLVAGFSDNLGFKEINSFFEEPIEWDLIKEHCKKFVSINSDNDKYVPLHHGEVFKEKLGAELIVQKNKGHFSGSEGTTELPVALESILGIV